MHALSLLFAVFAVGIVPSVSFLRQSPTPLETSEKTFLYQWYTNDTMLLSPSTPTIWDSSPPFAVTELNATRTLTSKMLYYMSFGESRSFLLHRQWDAYDKLFLTIAQEHGVRDRMCPLNSGDLRRHSPFNPFLGHIYLNYAHAFYVQRTEKDLLNDETLMNIMFELFGADLSELTYQKLFGLLPFRMKHTLFKYFPKIVEIAPFVDEALKSESMDMLLRDYLLRKMQLNNSSATESDDSSDTSSSPISLLKETEEDASSVSSTDNGVPKTAETKEKSKSWKQYFSRFFSKQSTASSTKEEESARDVHARRLSEIREQAQRFEEVSEEMKPFDTSIDFSKILDGDVDSETSDTDSMMNNLDITQLLSAFGGVQGNSNSTPLKSLMMSIFQNVLSTQALDEIDENVEETVNEMTERMTEWETFYTRVSNLSKKTQIATDAVVKQVYPQGPAIEDCIRSINETECVRILSQTVEKTSGTNKEYVQTVLDIVQGKELNETEKDVFKKKENTVVGLFYRVKELLGLKKAKYPSVFTEVEEL